MRLLPALLASALAVPSCGPSSRPAAPTAPPTPPPVVAAPAPPAEAPPPAPTGPYPLDEALADVLAEPLTHLGTIEWFGLARSYSCVYRNGRVLVVNLYCSPRDSSAFGLVVLSPSRGRVKLYAEAEAPISSLRRADYFTFKGESSPALVDAKVPALELGFTTAQLRAWDERRYRAFQPACFGGIEAGEARGGCLRPLEHLAAAWAARNQPLLTDPPEAWYEVVRLLRGRAMLEGRLPARR